MTEHTKSTGSRGVRRLVGNGSQTMFSKSSFGRLGAGFLVACFVAPLGQVVVSSADPISEQSADAATDSATAITPGEPKDGRKKGYLIVFAKSTGYVEGVSPREQPAIQEHIKYITGLWADGVSPLAGALFEHDQLTEVSGVLYFVLASNMHEARAVAMKEPFVPAEVVRVSSIWMFPAIEDFPRRISALSSHHIAGRAEVARDDSAKAMPAEASQNSPTNCYVVVFTKGTRYVERLAPAEQPGIARHREYLSGLYATGVVPLAGPLFEDDQGTRVCGLLYLVYAESLVEARDVVVKEPLVLERVLEISSIRRFHHGGPLSGRIPPREP